MTDATARYVIAADDKTKAALDSVRRGFKSVESSVKGSAKAANLALGILAGVGLKNMFRNVLEATADAAGAQSDFAKSLVATKKAATDLLAAKSGLPEVTANLNELREILTDPEVVRAADAITSSLIRGFGATAKYTAQTIAGLRIVAGMGSNQAVNIDNKVRLLEQERAPLTGLPDKDARKRYADLTRQIEDLKLQFNAEVSLQSVKVGNPLKGIGLDGVEGAVNKGLAKSAAIDQAEKDAKALKEIIADSANWSFELSEKMNDFTAAGAKKALEDDEDRAADRLAFFEDTFNREVEVYKEAQDKMSVYAEEAARNMQDALAEFLFDPFHDGLKGMLKGFVDTIRKMVAETAAANIFDSFGGSKGIASGLGGFAKKLLGFADGGSFSGREPFVVGERGPEIVVPGGSGSVIPNHKLGGGAPNITLSIDARGSTTDSVTQLRALMPSIIRQAVDMSRAAVRDDLSRRAYG